MSSASPIWHDLECGSYVADLPLWRSLVSEHGDPVLEIGAGTGRVALQLAQAGYRVTALDRDESLLAELARRADGLPLQTALADARDFDLPHRFATCLVPMQVVQLLGGRDQRRSFLSCVRRHLLPGGVTAIALAHDLECYDTANAKCAPLPDICERDGVVYCSQPTAVRSVQDGFVLERRRETVSSAGRRVVEQNVIRLDRVAPEQLEQEAAAAGLEPWGRAEVAPTAEHSGSLVVMLRA